MVYLSIDVEASGPVPGLYYLVSFGAVPVYRNSNGWVIETLNSFYTELKPDSELESPEAMSVHSLSREYLLANGKDPVVAMSDFSDYLNTLPKNFTVACWPSSFDFPYINYYLWKYINRSPVGYSGLDIGSLARGLFGELKYKKLLKAMHRAGYRKPVNANNHHALHDAIEQAGTLCWLLNRVDWNCQSERRGVNTT